MNKVTLEEAKGKVLYVRCHKDAIPGPYVKAFDLEEIYPGIWEAKIAMESMTLEQRRDFTDAVERHGGISKIIWTRYLEKGIVHRETSFKCSKGNFAKTIKEKQSMKVTVSFDVKDDQGSDFATITASYVGVPAGGVAHMEGLLISGFLQPLVDVASAQAALAA